MERVGQQDPIVDYHILENSVGLHAFRLRLPKCFLPFHIQRIFDYDLQLEDLSISPLRICYLGSA